MWGIKRAALTFSKKKNQAQPINGVGEKNSEG